MAGAVSTTNEARSTRKRAGSLDGLRGLALIAVLGYHVAPGAVRGGFLGVDSFFVLSGYLLTALLLDEHARNGAIDKGAYFVRRLRRIVPGLAVVLGALVVAVPTLAPDAVHVLRADVLASVAGVTNWRLIATRHSYFVTFGRPSLVRHLWSIAVEVQFYVVCPFLVAWLARRRRAVAVASLCAGIAASASLMAVLARSGDPSRAYYGTDTRIGALLVGCLVAVVCAGRSPRRHRRTDAVGVVALAVVAGLWLVARDQSTWSYPFAFLATEAATAGLIVSGLSGGPVGASLGHRWLTWLGRRSYGIYLWHWPAVALLRPGADVKWSPVVTGAVSIAFAVVAGALSYGLVERRFMDRRAGASTDRRRAFAAAVAFGPVGVALFVGLLVRLPTTDPLAETLKAGAHTLATQPPPPTVVTTTPSTAPAASPPSSMLASAAPVVRPASVRTDRAAAPRAVPAPAPPRRGPPPGSVPVTAIGDSVMVSAADALHARLGASGYIDAHQNRQWSEGVAVARTLREQGRLSRVVVVHLGNNGPVKASDVDAMMRELADVPHVLLVTVRCNEPWQNSVNQTLRDAAGRYPTITLVDWYARSAGHGDWFQSDDTHFKTTSGPGANAYADLIANSIPPPPPPPTTTTTAAPTTTTTTSSTTTTTTVVATPASP